MEHKYIDISKESKHLFKGFLQNNYFLNYNITMDTGHGHCISQILMTYVLNSSLMYFCKSIYGDDKIFFE